MHQSWASAPCNRKYQILALGMDCRCGHDVGPDHLGELTQDEEKPGVPT